MGLTPRLDLRGGRPCWSPSDADAGASDKVADGVLDVAIVGAGIMGAMLAERLTREGLRVGILDRRAPSLGATSASTALVMWAADTPLTHLAEQIGWASAVRRWRSVKAAVQALDSDLTALGIDCGWCDRPELYLAGDLLDDDGLRAEAAARRRAGLPSVYLPAKYVAERFGVPERPALLSQGAFEVDPVALTLGLLAAARRRGATATYPAEVLALEAAADEVRLITQDATLRARHVVLATGYEAVRPALPSSFTLSSSFAIATAPGNSPRWRENALIWEAAQPYLYARTTRDGRIIIGGEDEPFVDAEARDHAIKAKAIALARRGAGLVGGPPLSPDRAWGAIFGSSPDGLPAIGPVRGFEQVWLAAGFGGNGVSFARLAAELIVGAIGGAASPMLAEFSPYRF
jgi:glycine/D-amino acid oxidase-like deaminating enzyme